MQVVWSDEAITDYYQNIDYLIKEWSEEVAAEFIDDVETVITLIKTHPELYPLTDYRDIRRAVIRKQISLFFRLTDKEILLVRFWNNYKNPKSLKL